jgi:hypothetical protein
VAPEFAEVAVRELRFHFSSSSSVKMRSVPVAIAIVLSIIVLSLIPSVAGQFPQGFGQQQQQQQKAPKCPKGQMFVQKEKQLEVWLI